MADFKSPRTWPTSKTRKRGRLQGPATWPTSRPDYVADFKAPRTVATAEEQRPQSGRPTTRSWEAEDVRPVQAEPAERKHRRKGAGAEVEDRGVGRASSACPHHTAPEEAQSNGQHPARARMKARACRASARAQSTNIHFCLGRGRPRSTDLQSSRIISYTSALRRRASWQRRRVRIVASRRYTAA